MDRRVVAPVVLSAALLIGIAGTAALALAVDGGVHAPRSPTPTVAPTAASTATPGPGTRSSTPAVGDAAGPTVAEQLEPYSEVPCTDDTMCGEIAAQGCTEGEMCGDVAAQDCAGDPDCREVSPEPCGDAAMCGEIRPQPAPSG